MTMKLDTSMIKRLHDIIRPAAIITYSFMLIMLCLGLRGLGFLVICVVVAANR